jgi:hypothetical protein
VKLAASDKDGSPSTRQLFNTPTVNSTTENKVVSEGFSKAKSRGSGPGQKKTKMQAAEEEYGKKKAKIQERTCALLEQRQNDFQVFVNNQMRAQVFKMALAGYQTFKDDDLKKWCSV